jgi:hypothetical protein
MDGSMDRCKRHCKECSQQCKKLFLNLLMLPTTDFFPWFTGPNNTANKNYELPDNPQIY